MAFYRTCPDCGANLDPGEECDCRREKELERQKMQSMFAVGNGGQMQMGFIREVSSVAKMGI